MDIVCQNEPLSNALEKLNGSALSSVEFVADYVQLRFDGPQLTAYTCPSVTLSSITYVWGQPGYRDALCEQIGRQVKRATIDAERVSIIFERGADVSISLRPESYCGPEALAFSLDNTRLWVV